MLNRVAVTIHWGTKCRAWYEQSSLVMVLLYSYHLCYEYSGAFQLISSVSYYLLYIEKHITFYLLHLAIYSLGTGLFSNSSLYFIIPIGQCHYFKILNLKYIFCSILLNIIFKGVFVLIIRWLNTVCPSFVN